MNFLLGVSLFGQEAKPSFTNKKNQHTIDFQYMSTGYSYAHQFKPNLTLGMGVHIGAELQLILLATPILYDFGYDENGPGKMTPSEFSMEIVKFNFFYRYAISKHFYFDAGPFASYVLSDSDWDNVFNAGIETTINYLIWKFSIGIKLRGAYSFDNPYDKYYNPDKSYFALFLTPLSIGINF